MNRLVMDPVNLKLGLDQVDRLMHTIDMRLRSFVPDSENVEARQLRTIRDDLEDQSSAARRRRRIRHIEAFVERARAVEGSCRHGHLKCSARDGGPCMDEMLHELDDLEALEEALGKPPMNNTGPDYRRATFMAAAKGMRAYRCALAFNRLRPGVDFRGLTKRELADEFATGFLANVTGDELRRKLEDFR